ncbi:MAG: RNA polymerase sigma factor [Cryomorphaceae bacterium]|nr:RNA polymerase sigma factor [Cryomorphaceae bacterium]
MSEVTLDERLKEKCLAGKQHAIRELYQLCFAELYRVSVRYGNHPEDVQEIIDNSFLKVLKGLKSYQNHKKFGAWVRTVAINTALDFVRKQQRERKLFSDRALETVNEAALDSGDLNSKLEVDDIMITLKELPEQQRIILNLYAIEGYSHNEIGEMLGISAALSRWYLSSARKILKEKLHTKNISRYEGA